MSTDSQAANQDRVVNVEVRNSTGILELNRPRALNSLNQEMVDIITEALEAWRDDDAVHRVLIHSSSERGFCAGGDVRAVREAVLDGDLVAGDRYFTDEFEMNNMLGSFPKPVVAVIDGVVMGGGLGVSMHGSHRVITEKAFASMPEMAIGYTPDVGFTYMSQRASTPAVATFLGVTGWRLSPEDMLWAGLATDLITSEDAQDFIQTVITTSVDEALEKFAVQPTGESELSTFAADIEETFGFNSWQLIDAALNRHSNTDFVERVRELMAPASPSAVVAAVVLFAANRDVPTLRAGLDNELVFSRHMIRQPDFAEGVRTVLVDKDRNPSFDPSTFDAVDESVFRDLVS